ncbi:MAG: acyltransferase family protein [Lachnospiraceae bacterium]|nr:acyltransferase family protein [Lachnospiraceae bacterium]
MEQRKAWLDNIRWMTIVIVVIYHVFYYYHNIGVDPMFKGLAPNPAVEGGKAAVTPVALFQYFVYPWFMMLLFVVSGIVANIVLKKKNLKAFLSERVNKLLVPSTLGILTMQWLGGYLISFNYFTADEKAGIPGFVRYLIYCVTGIGALWFCHVLFVCCLLLALIKKIDKNDLLTTLGSKASLPVLFLLTIVVIGAAQLLNTPITTYRMCLYPLAFLLGYYVFSNETVQLTTRKYAWLFLTIGIAAEIAYICKDYGQYYADHAVQNDPIAVIAAWFMVLAIVGMAQQLLNFSNTFTAYMSKAGWGIYIIHINVMLLTNTLLKPVAGTVPMCVIYLIELVAAFGASILLWEILRRIPVVRWLLFGIERRKHV